MIMTCTCQIIPKISVVIVALFILVLFISCTKSFISFWLFSALAWYLEQLKLNACCKGQGHTYFGYY